MRAPAYGTIMSHSLQTHSLQTSFQIKDCYITLIVLSRIKIFAIVYYACSCGIVRNKNSRHTYNNMWDNPAAFCRSLNKLLTYPMLLSIFNILSFNRKFAVMI